MWLVKNVSSLKEQVQTNFSLDPRRFKLFKKKGGKTHDKF